MTKRKYPSWLNKAWKERIKTYNSNIKIYDTKNDEELLISYPLIYYASNLNKKKLKKKHKECYSFSIL